MCDNKLSNYPAKINIKKILIILLVFVIIGVIFTTTILIIVNDIIDKVNNSSAIVSTSISKINYEYDINETLKTIKFSNKSNNYMVTYDNKYIVYLTGKNIEIVNINSNNNDVEKVTDENEIIYITLNNNCNDIIYITKKYKNDGVEISFKIYNIENKIYKKYNKVFIKDFSKIKQIEYNRLSNTAYINIETKTLTNISNTLYFLDLTTLENKIVTEKIIDNMLLLNSLNNIYYIDNENNIYKDNNIISINDNQLEIIGSDEKNNVYYLDSVNKSKVYKTINDKVTEEIILTDSDLVSYYSNKSKVYLIYPTYILDITSNNKYERIFKLSRNMEFTSIVDDMIYLKSDSGDILYKKIK